MIEMETSDQMIRPRGRILAWEDEYQKSAQRVEAQILQAHQVMTAALVDTVVLHVASRAKQWSQMVMWISRVISIRTLITFRTSHI
jgi:hypothetical protein